MSTYKIIHNKRKIGVHSSIFGENREYAIITINDLTTIKKYEKERLSVRFQEMYFRNMAHNVRTPLSAVVATNENLKMELQDHPECLRMIELSESSCYILLSMFDQIDELQKIRFGKFVLTPKTFDLRAVLVSLFNKMRVQAEFNSLNMHLNIEQLVPKKIKTDRERLERVLFVLLQNSLKYTVRGCIKVVVETNKPYTTEQALSMTETILIFKIIDTGCGIPEENQP